MKGIGYAIAAVLMMATMGLCMGQTVNGNNNNITLTQSGAICNIFPGSDGIYKQEIYNYTNRDGTTSKRQLFLAPEKIITTAGVKILTMGKINGTLYIIFTNDTGTYNFGAYKRVYFCGYSTCNRDWKFEPKVSLYTGDPKWITKLNASELDASDYNIRQIPG